jgi:Na+/melibiose symporter-like transporter
MTHPVATKVGWRTSVPFGIGALASAAKTVPVTTFLMLFYNQVQKLPAITVS